MFQNSVGHSLAAIVSISENVELQRQEITDHDCFSSGDDGGTMTHQTDTSFHGSHSLDDQHTSILVASVDNEDLEQQPLLTQQHANLQGNPLYKCLQADLLRENETEHSCGTCTRDVSRLHSYRIPFPCIARWDSRPNVLSPRLERALTAGQKMLFSLIFPLVKSNCVRFLWAASQLISALILFTLAFLEMTSAQLTQLSKDLQVILTSLFSLLTLVDTFYCAWQCIRNSSCWRAMRLTDEPRGLVYKYNDVLRLGMAEVLLYLIIVTGYNRIRIQWSNYVLSLVVFSAAAFIVIVGVQCLVIVRIAINTRHHLEAESPSRRKVKSLVNQFICHFFGQRVTQTMVLGAIFVINSSVSSYWYETTALLIVTTIGLVAFFVLRYGWVQDLYIVLCTDYLKNLARLAGDQQTPQTTKETIEAILRRFEFADLCEESKPFAESNTAKNFTKSLQSPIMILLCVPNLATAAILFYFIATSGVTLSTMFTSSFDINNINGFNVYILSLPIFWVVSNVHLVLVGISWIIILVCFFLCCITCIFCIFSTCRCKK